MNDFLQCPLDKLKTESCSILKEVYQKQVLELPATELFATTPEARAEKEADLLEKKLKLLDHRITRGFSLILKKL
jgi:hypothetical protein